MSIGNLEAIRDWSNEKYYTKEEIIKLLKLKPTRYIKATPKMTGESTPSGRATCSSYANWQYQAYFAFDEYYGYDTSTWATVNALPQWIQYQFPNPVCIKKLITVHRNEDSGQRNNRAVSNFTFQASNDGTNWVNLKDCVITQKTSHYKAEFEIDNDNEYTYYRLYVTGNFNNSTGTGCGFAEVEMYIGLYD